MHASITMLNRAWTNTRSIVFPIDSEACCPDGVIYQFSGESDGPVTSQPWNRSYIFRILSSMLTARSGRFRMPSLTVTM